MPAPLHRMASRGKIVAQPHHHRAKIDGARLLGRLFRPCDVIGVGALGIAGRRAREFQLLQRRGKGRRRGIDRQMRAVDAAKLLGARMHVHERQLRARNVKQRVALRRQLAEPAADHDDKVGRFYAFEQLWIGPDAEIAGIASMGLVEQRTAAERRGHRKRIFLRKAADGVGRSLRPAAAAEQHDRRAGGAEHVGEFLHLGRSRRRLDRRERRRVGNGDALDQHVFRQRDDDRARPAIGGGVEGARDDFRHPRRIVDLGRPFGHRAKKRAVVDFLEGLALAGVARDLADEQHQRGRILLRNMDAVRSIGGAGPAGDETDARPAGRLADRLRHHAGAAFLAADGDGQIAVMEGVEHREIALARHAKDVAHAMDAQLIDQHLGGATQIVLGAHRQLPCPVGPALFRAGFGMECASHCRVNSASPGASPARATKGR